jgi:hypothetical protein
VSLAWTDDAAADVRRLYLDEGKSAAQVARIMGAPVTRSAIIGLAARRGWTKGAQPSMARPVNVPAAPQIAATVEKGETGWAKRWPAGPEAKLLRDLEVAECHWPVGVPATPADQLFCGERANGAYCAHHRRKAFQRGATK